MDRVFGPEGLSLATKVILTSSLIANALYSSVAPESKQTGRLQGKADSFSSQHSNELPPQPGLSDGNYDYWQVAKVEYRLNPATKQFEWANLLQPGEDGYVKNLNSSDGPPYEVEGFNFVKEGEYGGGVTIFEYSPVNDNTNDG